MMTLPERADLTEPATREAIAQEQSFLDHAFARRDEILSGLRLDLKEPGAGLADPAEQARARLLADRYAEVERAENGLVFGRLDGLDGPVRHLGRVGIPAAEEDVEPLVVDWRAPVARPFYTATPLDPQGQARRRHIRTEGRRVTGVDDEPLDSSVGDGDLVGEGALLEALSRRRTGRMGTAVATLQREQDAIVRANARGPLVVQGGPGTGKTVVALHRVAYLLFTHPHLAKAGVLVIGPSTRFLDYIGQVLPALGETQVVATTCARLVPGVVASRWESRQVAEIKGRALWQDALTVYVDALVPEPQDLHLRFGSEDYVLDQRRVRDALHAARSGGRAYHPARRDFVEWVHGMLVDAIIDRREELLTSMENGFEEVLARVDAKLARADDRGAPLDVSGVDIDGTFSEAEVESLRERVAADIGVAAALDAWWPILDADTVLSGLLADPAVVHRHAVALSRADVEAITGTPDGWAPSDIALLDAIADLLGDDEPAGDQGDFLAERAAARRDWVYGHVVVDEAQELSPMEWVMLLRRCPSRSITAVGDIDQTAAPHPHTSWAEAVEPAFGHRWTQAQLTICYRTPREVMALTGPVLERAGGNNQPPRSVRTTGIEPSLLACTEAELERQIAESVRILESRYDGGTVAVIAPRRRVAALRRAFSDGVPVLGAAEVKGLEFDATVVVDPDGIASEPRGWNALYVALTRCTQELWQLTVSADGQDGGRHLEDR